MADEAYLIGPAPARESYLRDRQDHRGGRHAGADCIHPGYGFLSENAEFAEACAEAGIVFVGPPPKAIRAMGLKDAAKALMEKAGRAGRARLSRRNSRIRSSCASGPTRSAIPVLIKAVAGGGGKGMRRVDRHAEFEAALEARQREAAIAFGDPRVLIEKYVTAPRHIEMQVFADGHGNVIHLNRARLLAPAPPPEGDRGGARAGHDRRRCAPRWARAAAEAARAVGYRGAGTVEFIADGGAGCGRTASGSWR